MQLAQAVKVLLNGSQQGQTAEELDKLIGVGKPDSLWEKLRWARESLRQRCLILLPVHSEAPQHWSLLSLIRKTAAADSKEPNQFKVIYLDSLAVPVQSALEVAAASLQLLTRLVQPAVVNQPGLPLAVQPKSYKQADMYSCGYWVLKHSECLLRMLRQEGWRAPEPDIQATRVQLNNWLTSLLKFPEKQKRQQEHQEETAEVKEEKKQKLAEAIAAAGASSSTSLPMAPLPANSVQQDQLKHGCSKRRYSARGCLACSAVKAVKYAEAKLADSQP